MKYEQIAELNQEEQRKSKLEYSEVDPRQFEREMTMVYLQLKGEFSPDKIADANDSVLISRELLMPSVNDVECPAFAIQPIAAVEHKKANVFDANCKISATDNTEEHIKIDIPEVKSKLKSDYEAHCTAVDENDATTEISEIVSKVVDNALLGGLTPKKYRVNAPKVSACLVSNAKISEVSDQGDLKAVCSIEEKKVTIFKTTTPILSQVESDVTDNTEEHIKIAIPEVKSKLKSDYEAHCTVVDENNVTTEISKIVSEVADNAFFGELKPKKYCVDAPKVSACLVSNAKISEVSDQDDLKAVCSIEEKKVTIFKTNTPILPQVESDATDKTKEHIKIDIPEVKSKLRSDYEVHCTAVDENDATTEISEIVSKVVDNALLGGLTPKKYCLDAPEMSVSSLYDDSKSAEKITLVSPNCALGESIQVCMDLNDFNVPLVGATIENEGSNISFEYVNAISFDFPCVNLLNEVSSVTVAEEVSSGIEIPIANVEIMTVDESVELETADFEVALSTISEFEKKVSVVGTNAVSTMAKLNMACSNLLGYDVIYNKPRIPTTVTNVIPLSTEIKMAKEGVIGQTTPVNTCCDNAIELKNNLDFLVEAVCVPREITFETIGDPSFLLKEDHINVDIPSPTLAEKEEQITLKRTNPSSIKIPQLNGDVVCGEEAWTHSEIEHMSILVPHLSSTDSYSVDMTETKKTMDILPPVVSINAIVEEAENVFDFFSNCKEIYLG